MATCLTIIGIIWLVITNLAIIIAFSTPYWSEEHMFSLMRNDGLWASCNPNECTWFFENDFRLENLKPDWFKAVQALFALGLGFGLLALLFATFALCCESRKCNFSAAISTVLILAFLAIAISLIIYGVKGNDTNGIGIELTVGVGRKFGWSFWLGVASALLTLLTSMLYACDCRKRTV